MGAYDEHELLQRFERDSEYRPSIVAVETVLARTPPEPGSEATFAAASVSAAYVRRCSRVARLDTIIMPMLPISPNEKPSANSESPT